MSEKKKEDTHYYLGDQPLRDEEAAQQSCAIDAADDKQWFADHPAANRRERLASCREQKANGLMPGALAVIFRGPHGCQIRVFVSSDPEMN